VITVQTAATRATARYHSKKGLVSKSYKLDKNIVDMFAEACENAEASQSEILTKYMKYFITRHHPDYE
jgi:hypothetical protein